ncbi:MAG: hypothetical protein IJT83_02440 [Victivallales bacterium]|nr:hypothetical protein [Victivallales bacterium]
MPQQEIEKMIEEMATLLTTIQSKEEFALLLDGILTPAEVESIHLRWQLLKLLKSGVTQRDIQSRLGICLGKISRGSRMLKYGKEGFTELVDKLIGGQQP